MANEVPVDIYPFATQDGQAIPLDIIRPIGTYIVEYLEDEVTPLAIPDYGTDFAAIYTSTDALIKFNSSISLITGPNANALFCRGGTLTIVSLPSKVAYIQALHLPGTCVMQFIQKWAGLALPRQWQKK